MSGHSVSRRQFLQSAALLGATAGLVACAPADGSAPQATEQPAAGGEEAAAEQVLILHQDAEPTQGLDPGWVGGWWRMTTLAQAIYSGLLFINADGEVEPDLATEWEFSDDNRVWTFYMREDALFNDGSPLTADDVKFTLERAFQPMTEEEMNAAGNIAPSSQVARQLLNDVVGADEVLNGERETLPEEAIQVLDPHTIQITLVEGRSDFPSRIGYYAASVIKQEQVEASEPGNIWYEQPIASGPFMIESWTHDQEIVLVPNPHYYGTAPTLDRIVMPIVPDPQTGLIMYENEELEVMKPELIDVEEFVQEDHPFHDQLQYQDDYITAILRLNALPPLDDVHLRRALELTIDKELLTQAVLGGVVDTANTFIQPVFPGYDMSGAELNHYDPEAAQAELAESQWGDDPSSMPTIRMFVAGGLAAREGIAPGTWQRLAAAIQEMWTETLGVPVEIKAVELESETLDTVAHVTFTRWGAFYPAPIAMVDRWVNDVADLEAVEVSETRRPIDAPGLQEIQTRARAASTQEEQWDVFTEFETLRAENVPYIPLYFGRTYVLVKPWVENFRVGPMWNFPSLNEVEISARS